MRSSDCGREVGGKRLWVRRSTRVKVHKGEDPLSEGQAEGRGSVSRGLWSGVDEETSTDPFRQDRSHPDSEETEKPSPLRDKTGTQKDPPSSERRPDSS